MFGKHNIIKNNRETSMEEQTPEASNPWQETMANTPTFEQHMNEGKTTESEKPPLDVESLREVTGFSEQLEEMGANQEILSNPAFKRVLEKVLSESGLKYGTNLEGSNNPNNSQLELACQRDKNSFLGSSQHDCSNFSINVKENGNFTIDYAYVDRDKTTMNRAAFAGANLPPHTEKVDAFNDVNVASRLEFMKHQSDDGFNIDIIKLYENQLSPTADSKNVRVGIYSETASESTRSFNAEGIETSRSDINYEPRGSEGANYLFTFIKPNDNWGGYAPSRASFNGLEVFKQNRYTSSNKVEGVTQYSRNPDGNTVKISGHDRDGKFGADSVRLNTEHGIDDIVVNASIEDLRSVSAE